MKPPFRVLHVQHSLDPGGMENGVVNVARMLKPRGFEFHVACLSHSGDFAGRLPDPSLVHSLGKPDGFSPRTVMHLRRLIRRIDPNVVHSHNLGGLIYAACATLFGRSHPILHGEHGRPDDGRDAARRSRQRNVFFKTARKVHTVSHDLLAEFRSSGVPSSKLLALVNGVDTEHFHPGDRRQARAELDLPPNATVLVIVGRLAASKQHLLLFQALEEVAASLPAVILLVVGGGGPDEKTIQEAARTSKVADRIRMEGFQASPLSYYQAADLLVAPSRIEGLSNVVLEAMACGLPALVHNACGSREVIQHGIEGVVTDLDSAERLAEEIVRVLSDPTRLLELGQNARQRVISHFSLSRMADNYEQTYRELAGAGR